MKLEVRVHGIPEFEALCKEAPAAARAILPKAVLAGMRPVYAATYAAAPKKTWTMVNDMKVELAPSDEAELSGVLGFLVGNAPMATAAITFGDKGWYWRLVEYGHAIVPKGRATEAHRIARKARRAKAASEKARVFGMVRARPFVRPSFDLTKDQAAEIVAETVRDAVAARGV